MKTKFELKSVLFVLITYAYALLLSDFTKQINLFWFFYVVPVFIAAFYYGIVGSLVVGVVSFGTLGFWMWYSKIFSSPFKTVNTLFEMSLGILVFFIIGIFLGFISQRWRSKEEQLEHFSVYDKLTGVYNYSYFIDRLNEEINRADRYEYPLSLVMIDIDRFKDFNDTFGNQKGNALLEKLAKIIKRCVRSVDTTARYGGEEFVVLLPNVDSDAQVVAERIRKEVEKASFEGDVEQPQVRKTVSCGVATYPADAASDTELIVNSDEALFMAKVTGRNKVCVYSRDCIKSKAKEEE
jgi:diguanylate cyclase (GGDEF)-like protein